MKKRALADEENAEIHPGKNDVGLPRVDRDEEAHSQENALGIAELTPSSCNLFRNHFEIGAEQIFILLHTGLSSQVSDGFAKCSSVIEHGSTDGSSASSTVTGSAAGHGLDHWSRARPAGLNIGSSASLHGSS